MIQKKEILIAGAGPSGLATAFFLYGSDLRINQDVYEQLFDSQIPTDQQFFDYQSNI